MTNIHCPFCLSDVEIDLSKHWNMGCCENCNAFAAVMCAKYDHDKEFKKLASYLFPDENGMFGTPDMEQVDTNMAMYGKDGEPAKYILFVQRKPDPDLKQVAAEYKTARMLNTPIDRLKNRTDKLDDMIAKRMPLHVAERQVGLVKESADAVLAWLKDAEEKKQP